ncbi:phosphatase PAP2 family protein [Prosthecochloris sp. SCSIO W1101]|uniref:phosphatase PAP2 family protein n=1 Tax=Prosthecochloris sp. SCSIO W1101 TaxID=2992242 RepID=UPI00223CEF79|nr:phosphatase PAP2 family protein [Prosthecochloris sp. SCSIO W1101]UZJ41069.1 phosphatase PAP2 family protein [Prosthecochloris sp. SCSIO W1101]
MPSSKIKIFFEYFSRIFHPILNAGVAFLLLTIFSENNNWLKVEIYFTSLLFSVLLPYSYIMHLKEKGYIESIELIERIKRINPLTFSIICYYIGFLFLKLLDAPFQIQGLMFCYGTNVLLIVLITKWWKVSVHTTGMAGPLVALSFKFGDIIYPFYVLVIIMGTARVFLKRHTIMQVVVGAMIGILLTYIQFVYIFL